MWQGQAIDPTEEHLLLAGQKATPGMYREMGSGRVVLLEQDDVLPATLDGRIGCYMRLGSTWAQTQARWHAEHAGQS